MYSSSVLGLILHELRADNGVGVGGDALMKTEFYSTQIDEMLLDVACVSISKLPY